jgi:DNA-directed RNA polymerase subunit RPC12/RpoP
MPLEEPKSMDECVYFTNRFLINEGYIKCWVLRKLCPKCGKGLIGKPKDSKTGKPKIRATIYECPACKYSIKEQEYEETLEANIKYKCPYCKHESETQVPFKRKKVQRINEETGKKESVDALIFNCSNCSKRIEITRKMK